MLKQKQVKNTVTFNDSKDIIIEFFYPEVVFKSIVINLQLYFSRATLNETLTTKYNGVLPRTP